MCGGGGGGGAYGQTERKGRQGELTHQMVQRGNVHECGNLSFVVRSDIDAEVTQQVRAKELFVTHKPAVA